MKRAVGCSTLRGKNLPGITPWLKSLGGVSLLVGWAAFAVGNPADAAQRPLVVAVASNFALSAKRLESEFSADRGVAVEWIVGSTGLLYSQIVSGLPVDLLLAADLARPRLLVEQGMASEASLSVYALGRLALWVPGAEETLEPVDYLKAASMLAIANPRLAPYGWAAEAYPSRLEGGPGAPKRILGPNVATAFAQVASGAAPAGLVALSQLLESNVPASEYAVVPDDAHPAIEQALVLTQRGAAQAAARQFRDFLLSSDVAQRLEAWGYGAPAGSIGILSPSATNPAQSTRVW